jgi:predicted NBD/HSP70 family sugar kinase
MTDLSFTLKHVPALDRTFLPAALWNRAYETLVAADPHSTTLILALERSHDDVSALTIQVLTRSPENNPLTFRYVERLLKFLLWQKGGKRVYIAGRPDLARNLKAVYSERGDRRFDFDFIGQKVYGHPLEVIDCYADNIPKSKEKQALLGKHWKGCRIGFDLGGSDRKCAAVIDGEVVFSEEIPWDPYFQKSSQYHYQGIQDSLQRAAKHLPRVDAIGGSAAGIYVDNEVRVASLFRGIPSDEFDQSIRPLFKRLQQDWEGIPFEVINDGEVTALAGSVRLGKGSVLGISLGTSQAGGFVNKEGNITTWLNELAFAPIDYAPLAHIDEWSGDRGCGVQYFSQQAVARLAPKAGIAFSDDMPLPERLEAVQQLMRVGDERARLIYLTIGTYLGYSIAHYHRFYSFKHLLLLGRVTSGVGGEILLAQAQQVLSDEFPEIQQAFNLITPDEKQKRHGQAIAAASLPYYFPFILP